MLHKVKALCRKILTPQTFGMMVVNGSYFRPMDCSGALHFSHKYFSDEQYLEMCEKIRESL